MAWGNVRVAVIGDALVAGVGDPKGLGWVGRVSARTSRDTEQVTIFGLGVPGETSAELLERWKSETNLRFGDRTDACRLVIGLGHSDAASGVTLARTRLNLADMLDDANQHQLPVMVVGPPPGPDTMNGTLADLSGAYADVCVRRGVPYVDTFTPLVNHEEWLTDMAAGDGVHPGQAGYGLIAWLVLHHGWHSWLGLPEPA